MTLLILGFSLWWAIHLFPISLPARRAAVIARMGEIPYKVVFALISLAAFMMMSRGYREAEFIAIWTPPGWTMGLNNLLMVLAVFLLVARYPKSPVRHYVRHPMLAAVKVWALAHLLVNGDLASIFLFGGMLAWAVVAMIGTNRRDGAWQRPAKGTGTGLVLHSIATLVVYAAIVVIHGPILGVYTFPQ